MCAAAAEREAEVAAAERLMDHADAARANPLLSLRVTVRTPRTPIPASKPAPHSLHEALLLHEVVVLTNLHLQAINVQNIRTLVPIVFELNSHQVARAVPPLSLG